MRKLLVIGSLNMDLVVYTERLPNEGETLLGTDFQTFPGGKGANQAVAAARLGADVSILGRVGSDDFGAELIRSLAQNGVGTGSVLRESDSPTGTAVITVDASGQNTIVVVPGSNFLLSPEDILAHQQLIHDADLVLLQLEIPLETVQQAAEVARSTSTRVILNPAPACELPQELLRLVDVLVPNETEAALLSGRSVQQPGDLFSAARQLRERGVGRVLITRGDQGAYYQDANTEMLIPACAVEAVDATAAGDAFIGAYAAALSQGLSHQVALRWSAAAGALTVTRRGAQSSLPSREELEQFLQNDFSDEA
jgi:ribokinase